MFAQLPSMIARSVRVVAASTVAVLVLLATLFGLAGPAGATWSLVGVEPESGRVGAVMASCVPAGLLGEPDQALVPVVLVPGVAAAVAQGSINPDSPVGLRQLLGDGADAQLAIDTMLELDDQPTARQFGVATMIGTATHSGADIEFERADAQGETVAAQGVLLADEAVVADAIAAFERATASGQTLEQALVAGLLAGSAAGGDRRCDDQTALFAHLVVADPGDDGLAPSTLLTVTVDEGDGQNPVSLLAEALADGRSGWVDAGLNDPVGIPRIAVMAVGTVLAVAAFFTIRKGLGSPSARR